MNLLKVSSKQTKKTLDQIYSTLSASSPNVKKSWCLWMKASVKFLPGLVIPEDHTVLMDRRSSSTSCAMFSGLTGAHYSKGVIPCTVCCFWVTDPDHHDRGPHQPVAVFLDRPGQCFVEPFSGCPYSVCYPNCPTRGQSVICFSWVLPLVIKGQEHYGLWVQV